MANQNDDRYGINPHRWRRVYGRTRKRPQIVEFFDSGSQQNKSFDLQKTYRHRDYFIVKGTNRRQALFSLPGAALGEYEEGLIVVDNVDELSASFSSPFSGTPFVVYSVEEAATGYEDSENVNIFGTALPTSNTMYVGLSAPFSGTIRYRAVWAASYPIQINSPTSGVLEVYADSIDITNATEYTASYTLTTAFTEFRATFHDSLSNNETNVGLLNDTQTSTTSTNTLTAPSSGQIHFITYGS